MHLFIIIILNQIKGFSRPQESTQRLKRVLYSLALNVTQSCFLRAAAASYKAWYSSHRLKKQHQYKETHLNLTDINTVN